MTADYPSAYVCESTDSPAMFCPNFLALAKSDHLVLPLRHNYQSLALCMTTLILLYYQLQRTNMCWDVAITQWIFVGIFEACSL